MTEKFGTFAVLFVFFILEALCALLWFSGTFGMAAVSFMLLGGNPDEGLFGFWTLCAVWGVLFSLPAILQMVQSAVWTRGLSRTAHDLGVTPKESAE